MPEWLSDRRLWLTGDPENPNTRLVEEGDLEAAFLLCAKGQVVAAGYVERFDLPASLYRKQAEPAEDKMLGPAENKARRPRRPRNA